MAQETPDLAIESAKIAYILMKAREFDAKEELSDPDSGSNPSDDKAIDILEDRLGDPTLEEYVGALEDLNVDEQLDLITLMWIGRGDYAADQWEEARSQAASMGHKHIARYIAETPLASDLLEEGLEAVGFTVSDFESDRL